MAQSITAFAPRRNLNLAHRKEDQAFYSFSLIDLDAGKERAVIRLYNSATGRLNFACLWINDPWASGSGRAGGYGYHRPSAAAHEAFRAAGITLAEPIDGRGDSAIQEAMEALGAHLGIKRATILKANG